MNREMDFTAYCRFSFDWLINHVMDFTTYCRFFFFFLISWSVLCWTLQVIADFVLIGWSICDGLCCIWFCFDWLINLGVDFASYCRFCFDWLINLAMHFAAYCRFCFDSVVQKGKSQKKMKHLFPLMSCWYQTPFKWWVSSICVCPVSKFGSKNLKAKLPHVHNSRTNWRTFQNMLHFWCFYLSIWLVHGVKQRDVKWIHQFDKNMFLPVSSLFFF